MNRSELDLAVAKHGLVNPSRRRYQCWARHPRGLANRCTSTRPAAGNCAIKSRIDDGYSVFLKTGDPLLVQRRIGQLQGERFEPAEVQLQRAIFFTFGAACTLKLRVRFSPAFFPIKHDAIPECVAPRDLVP